MKNPFLLQGIHHQLLARLLDALDSPAAGAIFDPGNDIFDERGEVPYPDGYGYIRKYIRHVHIKDAVKNAAGEPECVKVGAGLVRYPELLAALKADGYEGYCSLETHYRLGARISEELMRLPQGSGFSDGGMAATGEGALALEQLLKEVG